jgi:Domain of unknown function (DUF4203)
VRNSNAGVFFDLLPVFLHRLANWLTACSCGIRTGFSICQRRTPEPNLTVSFEQFHITPLVQILAGAALLFFGRKLFWVFVGVIGFVAGMHFGEEVAKGQPEAVILLIAIGTGLVAALLAVVLQRVAVAIAGGLAGGILSMQIAVALGVASEPFRWIFFIVGVVVAAILVSAVFDWALIGLSALTGAKLVSEAIPLDHPVQMVVMAVLFITGAVVQALGSLGNRSTS